jgi:hypothetical protein
MLNRIIITFSCGALFFASCTSPRFINAPVAINNPIFAKKGEASVTALYSLNDEETNNARTRTVKGVDVQAAAALTNHLFVMAGHTQRSEQDVFVDSVSSINTILRTFNNAVVKYKRSSTELAAGFYAAPGVRKTIAVKMALGVGLGNNSFSDRGTDSIYRRAHEAKQYKIFYQPSIDINFSPRFTLFYVFRQSFNWYGDVRTDYTEAEQRELGLLGLSNSVLRFSDFGFGLQFGFKQVPGLRLNGQANFVFIGNNYSRLDQDVRFRSRTSNLAFGLCYQFDNIFKRPPATPNDR